MKTTKIFANVTCAVLVRMIVLAILSVSLFSGCGDPPPSYEEHVINQQPSPKTPGEESENGGNTSGENNGNTSSAYIGTKAPEEPKEVGDIVFNDGSALPYTTNLALTPQQQMSAIAIIFYKGTRLNTYFGENDSRTDISTSRTLGVGFKIGHGLAWCTNSGASLHHRTDNIVCDTQGGVFLNDLNGSDNLEQLSEALGDFDDTSTERNYPAFYYAKNYKNYDSKLGDHYQDGWFLPSYAELYCILQNGLGNNKVFDLEAVAKSVLRSPEKVFIDSSFWSSSQYWDMDDNSIEFAHYIEFSNPSVLSINQKYITFDVCCIREFN